MVNESSDFLVPTDTEKLIAWLEKRRELGIEKLPVQQMRLNLAYVLGQQHVIWDNNAKILRSPEVRTSDPNAPVRITANKIGGIVERFIARIVKSAPEPETRPVTDDEDDVNAAKAGTRILQSEMTRLEWMDLLIRHYFWVVTAGMAYMQVVWDSDTGPVLGQVGDETVKSGNISIEIVPPDELSVAPDAKDMRSARWCVRTKAMTRETVWEAYGKVPAGAAAKRTIADEVNSASNQVSSGSDMIAVHQFWMVPCRAAPNGLVVTWSGTTLLEEPTPFPYNHRTLPFIQFDLLPGIGAREGRTWVNDLINLQADYNDARSREAAIRRTFTPKILASAGSIDPNAITSRVEVISYNPVGDRPAFMIPDSGWMSQYEAAMQRADGEMGDRAGQSDVSSGRSSSASMPAAAILALQEADDTKMAISFNRMAGSIRQVSWQMLELVRQFWTEERLVHTWSEEGALEVARFSSANVSQQLDIVVSTETGIARSKSAQVQLGMDLWGAGIITDPGQLLRLVKAPGTSFLAEAWNIDSRQANRENEALLLGEVVEVNTFDNHTAHTVEHDNMRKGDGYTKLKRRAAQGDQEAIAIIANIDAHQMVHNEMMLPQMGVPSPGSPFMSQEQGSFPNEEYIDPLTGLPPNPTMVASGAAPSALANSDIARRAGIGGTGQPGAVPGIDVDQQAASMGA